VSTEQTKAIVLQLYQAFDDRTLEQAFALLAPHFVAHLAGMAEPLDRNQFKQFGLSFYEAFSNGQHIFDEVIVEGNRVVTCGRFTANHLGAFQGLPPTGKQITIAIMHIDRVEDGKIVEHWGQGDAQGLMQQLGIVFLPGPTLFSPILKQLLARLVKKPIR
jgi:predicted ester cyclase